MFNEINPFLEKFDKRFNQEKIPSKLAGLGTATGAVIWAPTGGSRYIVDITFAATDTTFAITHGISDPKSICMSQNTVGTVNPTGLVWTRSSATVITISKDSLTNSAVLLRVELAVPSTIS